MTNITESKFAKTLDVGLYRFVAYIIILVFGLGVSWAVLSGTVQENSRHTENTSVHLDEFDIINNTILTNQVEVNKGDIDELTDEVDRIDDVQIEYKAHQDNLINAVGMLSGDVKELTKAVNEMNGN